MVLYTHESTYTLNVYVQSYIYMVHLTLLSIEVDLTHVTNNYKPMGLYHSI